MNIMLVFRSLFLVSMFAATTQAATPPAGESTLPSREWQAIRVVVGNQLKALKAGDGTKALTYATTGIREQIGSAEKFLTMVRAGYAPLLDARYTQFLDGAVIGGAVFQPLRLVLPDNTVLVALYQVEKQADGSWRIAGCAISPSTVIAT